MGCEVLFNFISPVTGRILCDPNMVLVGDARGIAIPTPFIPIGALPDLPMGNIWIGNNMNRPIPSPTITIDNLPNLSSGKVWVGNGMIPSRPVESTPPQGPPGPRGPAGTGTEAPTNESSQDSNPISSLVKYGLEQLVPAGASTFFSLFGSAVGGFFQGTTSFLSPNANQKYIWSPPAINGSIARSAGAQVMSGKTTFFISADMDFGGGRLENIAPSPKADYDAVNAKWTWDLFHDDVDILYEER